MFIYVYLKIICTYPDNAEAIFFKSIHCVLRQNGFQWGVINRCFCANGS